MMYGESVDGFSGAVRQGTESFAAAAVFRISLFTVVAFRSNSSQPDDFSHSKGIGRLSTHGLFRHMV